MKRFFEEPLKLPPEWQSVPPISKEFVAEFERVKKSGKTNTVQRVSANRTLRKIHRVNDFKGLDLEPFRSTLKEEDEFVQALIALGDHPLFDDDVYNRIRPHFLPDYHHIRNGRELLLLRAYMEASEGRWLEAFEASLAALHLSLQRSSTQPFTHLQPYKDLALGCVAVLIAKCDDPRVLRRTRNELDRVAEQIDFDPSWDPLVLRSIGNLRGAKQRGRGGKRLESGHPGQFYVWEPHLPSLVDRAVYHGWESFFEPVSGGTGPPLYLLYVAKFLGLGRRVSEWHYLEQTRGMPNHAKIEQLHQQLDKLRLEDIPARLAKLEKEKP